MSQIIKSSDIILASKKEYKKLHDQLNELKAMTELLPNKNNKFEYLVREKDVSYGESNFLLYIDIKNKKLFQKMIERFGIGFYGKTNEVLKDLKDNYYVKSNNFNIKITDKEKFDKIAENIKSSDFCNNFLTFHQSGLQEWSFMTRSTNFIGFKAELPLENKSYRYICKLYYDVRSDLLVISCPRGIKINKKVVETMLSLPFEIENDYVEDLIKNNSAYDKKIYVDSEIDAKRKVKLIMNETDYDVLVAPMQEKTMLKRRKKS